MSVRTVSEVGGIRQDLVRRGVTVRACEMDCWAVCGWWEGCSCCGCCCSRMTRWAMCCAVPPPGEGGVTSGAAVSVSRAGCMVGGWVEAVSIGDEGGGARGKQGGYRRREAFYGGSLKPPRSVSNPARSTESHTYTSRTHPNAQDIVRRTPGRAGSKPLAGGAADRRSPAPAGGALGVGGFTVARW